MNTHLVDSDKNPSHRSRHLQRLQFVNGSVSTHHLFFTGLSDYESPVFWLLQGFRNKKNRRAFVTKPLLLQGFRTCFYRAFVSVFYRAFVTYFIVLYPLYGNAGH